MKFFRVCSVVMALGPARRQSSSRGNLPSWLGCLACFALAVQLCAAATVDEALNRLRSFEYGKDAAALTEVQRLVATATAEAPGSPARTALADKLASLLESGASPEAKQFVCRQLALIGSARQVPALAKLLSDPKLADSARYALGPIDDPAVNAALLDALNKAEGKHRIGIVNTLGFRRDSAAVPAMVKLLDPSDLETAQAAAAALGRIGGEDAAAGFAQALPRITGPNRFWIADGYLACAETFLANRQTNLAVRIFRQLSSDSEPAGIRAAALRGLAMHARDGIGFGIAALRETEPAIVKAAISALQSIPGSAATRGFAAELPNLPQASQLMLLNALAERRDPAALPEIKKAAGSENASVRSAALQALGKLGDASTVDPLVAASEAAQTSGVALASLRTLRGDGVDEAIAARLKGAQPQTRAQLISVLADRGATSTVPVLLQIAQDSDHTSRSEAVKALAVVAGPEILPSLVSLLSSADSETTRDAAEEALAAVANRIPNPAQRADLLVSKLEPETRDAVKSSLIRVLGRVGNDKALSAVQRALSDSSETVRDAAVRSLTQWPNASARPQLMAIFEQGENSTHRTLALRGLVRLAQVEGEPANASNTLALYEQLLQKTRQSDEVKLVLSGLAQLAEPRAVQLISPHLENSATREEAAAAAAQVAAAIAGSQPQLARSTSERVLALSSNPSIRKQAEDILSSLEKFEGYIAAWQLAGPFSQSGKSASELFDVAFPPETPNDSSTQWRQVSAPVAAGAPAIIDLIGLLGGSDRVAYLRTWVHSEKNQDARLELGTDDGVKVWINGAVVHANNVDRGLTPGQDRAPVALKQGWNTILLKVTQGGGGWGACARLRDAKGSKLEHIRFDAARQISSASNSQ